MNKLPIDREVRSIDAQLDHLNIARRHLDARLSAQQRQQHSHTLAGQHTRA